MFSEPGSPLVPPDLEVTSSPDLQTQTSSTHTQVASQFSALAFVSLRPALALRLFICVVLINKASQQLQCQFRQSGAPKHSGDIVFFGSSAEAAAVRGAKSSDFRESFFCCFWDLCSGAPVPVHVCLQRCGTAMNIKSNRSVHPRLRCRCRRRGGPLRYGDRVFCVCVDSVLKRRPSGSVVIIIRFRFGVIAPA